MDQPYRSNFTARTLRKPYYRERRERLGRQDLQFVTGIVALGAVGIALGIAAADAGMCI